MSKTITLNYEGKNYVLEFTRASVERMERRGFVASEIATKPMTVLLKLFAGAFYANHPNITEETIEKIFSKIGNREDFIARLGEMYSEPLEVLMGEPKEEGKLEWDASW